MPFYFKGEVVRKSATITQNSMTLLWLNLWWKLLSSNSCINLKENLNYRHSVVQITKQKNRWEHTTESQKNSELSRSCSKNLIDWFEFFNKVWHYFEALYQTKFLNWIWTSSATIASFGPISDNSKWCLRNSIMMKMNFYPLQIM